MFPCGVGPLACPLAMGWAENVYFVQTLGVISTKKKSFITLTPALKGCSNEELVHRERGRERKGERKKREIKRKKKIERKERKKEKKERQKEIK